jgi:uncharacterized protein YqgC (DUF456 family)
LILLIVLGCLLVVVGLLGCVIPGLVGPPFSFLALILLSAAKKWEPFSAQFLVIMALLTIVATSVDYVFPAIGAKKYGASRAGFWGAVAGMILGILFFPPFGLIVGAFFGALVGEMLIGKQGQDALKAGWGVFVGILLAMLLKLIASGIMTFYFFRALF